MEPQNVAEPLRPQYSVGGSQTLCRIIANRDFDRARQILEISPNLINTSHPRGWAPIHTVILCGDPSFVKFVLKIPGLDLSKTDGSSFGIKSSKEACDDRQKELCADIADTFNSSGATALHFACMRADVEVLGLLVEMQVDHDIADKGGRLPRDYFDYERVDLQVLRKYQEALQAWQNSWRSRVKKVNAATLCKAISQQDYQYCKEILGIEPQLARGRHRTMMKLVEDLLNSQSPLNIPSHFLRPKKSIRNTWNYDSSDSEDENHTNTRAHTPASSALHYASLLGDIKAVELLLKNGANWTVVDDYRQSAGDYAALSMDERKLQKFKRLCEKHGPPTDNEEETPMDDPEDKKESQPQDESNTDSGPSNSSEPESEAAVPIAKRDTEEESRKRHLKIEEIISNEMIGQRGPIRSIASAIRLRANGWVDPDRPLVMLFLGSSGVGKTELAKRVAHYLHENDGKTKKMNSNKKEVSFGQSLMEIEKKGVFTRIDMSEYQHRHTVSNLTGSPKGYVGYDDGGVLTGRLRKNPKAIVLLDEIEKAHPDVLTVFLQLFDDGRITDPAYGTVYCPGAVFIMTSNLGSEEIKAAAPELQDLVARTEKNNEVYLQGIRNFTKRLYPQLKEAFKRDEFIGRINQTVVFLPFEHAEIAQMIERELTKWQTRAYKEHGIHLTWSPEVINRLVAGYDVNYGARSVINETQRLAIHLLAEAQIRGDIGKNWLAHIYINVKGDIDMSKQNPMARLLPRGCHYFL